MSELRQARLRPLHSQFVEAAKEFPHLFCAAVTPHGGEPLWPQMLVPPDGFHIGLLGSAWRDTLGMKDSPLPVPLCGTAWLWMNGRLWQAAFFDGRSRNDFRGTYRNRNIDGDELDAEDARQEQAVDRFKRLARQCAGNLNLPRPLSFDLIDIVKSEDQADRWLERLFCQPFVETSEDAMLVRRLRVDVFSASAMAIEAICENKATRREEHSTDGATVNMETIDPPEALAPPPAYLLLQTCQILSLARNAILAGKAVLKIRELHPDDPMPRIEEIAQVTINLSNIDIYLSPRSPTEDPRGGMVPLYRRDVFTGWFDDNPTVQHLFEKIWEAHTVLPDVLRQAVDTKSEEQFSRFRLHLQAFEGVVAELRRWYDANTPQPFATRPHQPTAQELSTVFRAMRQAPPKGVESTAVNREPDSASNGRTPFTEGTLVFLSDRVELCGADICSGDGSTQMRKVLEALAVKKPDNTFRELSTKQLLVAAELTIGEAALQGLVRRLRVRIQQALLTINIDCGLKDVILSRGPGYRLSNTLTVQFAKGPPDAAVGGTDATESVASVATHSVATASDSVATTHSTVATGGPHAVAAERRRWILEQLAAGRVLDAGRVAKELSCSLRAAQRDLAAVKKAGGSPPKS